MFDSFQVTFNILEQSTFTVLQEAKAKGKGIIIKEAMANGRVFAHPKYGHYGALHRGLNELCKKYQVGIDAIALRYCMDTLHPELVLSGASETQHLMDNLKANRIRLSQEDLAYLKDASVPPREYWEERSHMGWQ